MTEILPTCTEVELFLANHHRNNFVSLTTSKRDDSKQIFKWNNPFSWTYNGNLAGKSLIATSVRDMGGQIDGEMRFSIMWAFGTEDDSDLDAHCQETPGSHIYYSDKKSYDTGGELDVDIINPQSHKRNTGKNVVENITYNELYNEDRVYSFYVKNYSDRGSKGFEAEIEYRGERWQYKYNRKLSHKQEIPVATVRFKDGEFNIKHHIEPINSESVEKTIYGLKSQHFHKVNLVSLSPNYWGEDAIGNKHYFFFLDGAKTENSIRSFHNENLRNDLVSHRKVMEVLANTTMVESDVNTKELTGLGFNATIRDEVILRLKGSHKRVIKVKF